MRITLLAVLAVALLAGCGATEEADQAASPPPPPAQTVTGPADPPPKHTSGLEGPPPAWIETEQGAFWLGYSTFCWTGGCADYIAPRCGEEKFVPTISVRPGETVRFHLGFDPGALIVSKHLPVEQEGPSASLDSTREPSWQVAWDGATSLAGQVAPGEEGGDASYVACLRYEALTVPEALARGEGDVVVEGPLWADGDDVRLCDAVAESYPPQCPSGYLKVQGLDLATVANLNEAGGVRWTDNVVRLSGTLEGDVLHVRG